MLKNTLLVLTTIFICSKMNLCAEGGYDNYLTDYYSDLHPTTDDIVDRFAMSTSSNPKENNLIFRRLENLNTDVISIKEMEGEVFIGFYFVSRLNPIFSPFTEVFNEVDLLPSGHDDYQHSMVYLMDIIKCNLLEMYDVKLNCSQLNALKKIKNLKYIGLPARGMVFDCEFEFPKSAEVIVVRNASLNINFFNALSKCENLKKIIIRDCGFDLKPPQRTAFGYDEDSWNECDPIFRQICMSVSNIEIQYSDPEIFNYMLNEKWDKLTHLTVDLFSNNYCAINYLRYHGVRKVFPSIERATIRSRSDSRLNQIFRKDKLEYTIEKIGE